MEAPERLQDLPPDQARLVLKVEHFIVDELDIPINGTTVLIGLSGGPDSIALACILHYLAPKLKLSLVAAHMNHGLRHEAADEAEFARRFCEDRNIPFYHTAEDIQAFAASKGIGLEEAGRIKRYAFFRKTTRSTAADFIALGHQLNDLAEDVLLRLLQGSGWPNLAGMMGYRNEIIRPLLWTSKHECEAFLQSIGQPWCSDLSNEDESFLRNRIRKHILPFLIQENPNFLERIATLSKIGSLDREWFSQLENDFLTNSTSWNDSRESLDNCEKTYTTEIVIQKEHVKDKPTALRLRLYKAVLERLGPGRIPSESLFRLDEAVRSGRSPRTFQFPQAKTVRIDATDIVFSLKT